MTALELAETELDNFRAALELGVPPNDGRHRRPRDRSPAVRRPRLGLVDGRVRRRGPPLARTGHRAGRRHGTVAGPGRLSRRAGNLLLVQGEPDRAHELADAQPGDGEVAGRPRPDRVRAEPARHGQASSATSRRPATTLEEALDLLRRTTTRAGLARVLGNLAGIEEALGHLDRAEALIRESLAILDALGDVHEAAVQGQNLAYLLASRAAWTRRAARPRPGRHRAGAAAARTSRWRSRTPR